MKRGEVWLVDFEPSLGGEIRKRRPAVIVSNDVSNRVLNRVQVIPLTSRGRRIYPGEAAVAFRERPGKALADQLTTLSKRRIQRKLGRISPTEMSGIEQAIRIQLALG